MATNPAIPNVVLDLHFTLCQAAFLDDRYCTQSIHRLDTYRTWLRVWFCLICDWSHSMTGYSGVHKAQPLPVAVMQPSGYIRTSSKSTSHRSKTHVLGWCSMWKAAWLHQACACCIGELLLFLSEDNDIELLTTPCTVLLPFIIELRHPASVTT